MCMSTNLKDSLTDRWQMPRNITHRGPADLLPIRLERMQKEKKRKEKNQFLDFNVQNSSV